MVPCFLCGTPSSLADGYGDNVHSKATFVVRILFELGDAFHEHLTPDGLSKWWRTCEQCDKVIDESFDIYRQLVQVSDKFRQSQMEFVEKYERIKCFDEEDEKRDEVAEKCWKTLKSRNWETIGYTVPNVLTSSNCDEVVDVKVEVKIKEEAVNNSGDEDELLTGDAEVEQAAFVEEESASVVDIRNDVAETIRDDLEEKPRTRSGVRQYTNFKPVRKQRPVMVLPDLELNPTTNKFHCPSCTFSSPLAKHVRYHFRLGRHSLPFGKRRRKPNPNKPQKPPKPPKETKRAMIKHENEDIKDSVDQESKKRRRNVPTALPDLERNPSTNKFHCPSCDFKSAWKKHVRTHFRLGVHQPKPVGRPTTKKKPEKKPKKPKPIVHRDKKPSVLPTLELNPETNKYHCPTCDFARRLRVSVRRHYRRTHLRAVVYSCTWPDCGRKFATLSNFKGHMDRHNGTPRFQCSYCPLTFYTQNPLVRHTQTEHEGGRTERPFKCERCGKGFPNRDALYTHRNIHKTLELSCEPAENNGQVSAHKSYLQEEVVCDICGKTLKRGSLYMHMRSHQGNGYQQSKKTAKKWTCSECQNPFLTKELLEIHLYAKHKIGDPMLSVQKRQELKWQCDVTGCRKKFKHEERYKAHMDEAHGPNRDKPGKFLCRFCGQRFFLFAKHKFHETAHENEEIKPFPCDQCGKGFPTMAYLRYHKKHTHKMVLENIQGFRPGSTFNQTTPTELNQ